MAGTWVLVIVAALACGCSWRPGGAQGEPSTPGLEGAPVRVLLESEVVWEALNPARGALSPRAGTLWGDRNAPVPTGFLAVFEDGFSSPPHVHNVTYRAVVLAGLVHNDDPDAAESWMGPGSFWTQPRGEVHVTAAQGQRNVALVEIDEGPYLVAPPSEAFDVGERPLNLDASNVVWLPASRQAAAGAGASIAYLWGQLGRGLMRGVFVRLPPGFDGTIRARGSSFQGVVIRGGLSHGARAGSVLTPGSCFSAEGPSVHAVSAPPGQQALVYIRTNGDLDVCADG